MSNIDHGLFLCVCGLPHLGILVSSLVCGAESSYVFHGNCATKSAAATLLRTLSFPILFLLLLLLEHITAGQVVEGGEKYHECRLG